MGGGQSTLSYIKSVTDISTKQITELLTENRTNVNTRVIQNLNIKLVIRGDLKKGASLNIRNKVQGNVKIRTEIQKNFKTQIDALLQNQLNQSFDQDNKVVNDIFSTLFGKGETSNISDIKTYVSTEISKKISQINYDNLFSELRNNQDISVEIGGDVYDTINIEELSEFQFQAISIVNAVQDIVLNDKVINSVVQGVKQKNDVENKTLNFFGGDLSKILIAVAVIAAIGAVIFLVWKSQSQKSSGSSSSPPVVINNTK